MTYILQIYWETNLIDEKRSGVLLVIGYSVIKMDKLNDTESTYGILQQFSNEGFSILMQ